MAPPSDFFVDCHMREGGGDRLAFLDPWRSLTFAELAAAPVRFAAGLQAAEARAAGWRRPRCASVSPF
jgi:hypothetical protein